MARKNALFEEIKLAYRRLKSYVYYENFSIGLKTSIAEYESKGIEANLTALTKKVSRYLDGDKHIFNKDLKQINYLLMPKRFKDQDIDNDGAFYFSNLNNSDTYIIDDTKKITAFIDCSVDLHILTILWISRIGIRIDARLKTCCYGNRVLKRTKNEYDVGDDLKIFGRYYFNYNNWRDAAIKSAKKVHLRGNDVAILNLDIESYYHSIDLDVSKINTRKQDRWLNDILDSIHKSYSQKLFKDRVIKVQKQLLPIGLISSNILANYYLAPLDKVVSEKLKPKFYGRYVDDILIVFEQPKIDTDKKTFLSHFIYETFCRKRMQLWRGKKKHFAIERSSDSNFEMVVNGNILKFQLRKVKLYHLYATDSINVLNEFEREIRKNSSEFKFQLETDELFESFEDSSYAITYGDTVNKLRSIEKFNANKFGASKHLTKLIWGTKQTSKLKNDNIKNISNKIIQFFSGKRALELASLWDKVFIFFVINKYPEGLIEFSKHILRLLPRIVFADSELSPAQSLSIRKSVIHGLLNHLSLCYSMASALDVSFFNTKIVTRLKAAPTTEVADSVFKTLSLTTIKKLSNALIQSNLFRQDYMYYPLLNYCSQPKNFSFANTTLSSRTSFSFDDHKIEYSPRFIHYNEVDFFCYLQNLMVGKKMVPEYHRNRPQFILKQYLKINKSKKSLKSLINYYPKLHEKKVGYTHYKVNDQVRKTKLKVGLVNIKVNPQYSLNSLRKKPVLTFDRLDSINKVLNEAIKTRCNLVIFPEISIPFHWLSRLTDFAKRNDIGIVCGLEHFRNSQNEAFNYVATILPFNIGSYLNSYIDVRLKIDYAPDEKALLKLHQYKIPNSSIRKENLRLYDWRGTYFTVLNCFELTDIEKRAIFRGGIDYLITVEHNMDVNYFSSITESLARDIHCYVLQINTSNFGDSRITLPAETFKRDNVKIKGGDNISLITGTIDIGKLRKFQALPVHKQDEHKEKPFKTVPANFLMSELRKPK